MEVAYDDRLDVVFWVEAFGEGRLALAEEGCLPEAFGVMRVDDDDRLEALDKIIALGSLSIYIQYPPTERWSAGGRFNNIMLFH